MSIDYDPTDATGYAEIEKARNAIMEHFDSVLIIATRREGQTEIISRTGGNIYACRGSVESWLESQREEDRVDQRRRMDDA